MMRVLQLILSDTKVATSKLLFRNFSLHAIRTRSNHRFGRRLINPMIYFGHSHQTPKTCRFTTNVPEPRPFRVLGVQQIAVGGEDRNALRTLWIDILGIHLHRGNIRIESENVIEDILSVGPSPGVEIDLMTPIDPEKRPKVHIPPLNHVGLWVDDLEKAVAWMGAQGVRFAPGGIRKGAAGYDVAFIHPKANDRYPIAGNGVLVELVQAPESVKVGPSP